jgi:putative hemolysin
MRCLVDRNELMFGKKDIFASLFADMIIRALDINKINKLYNEVYDAGDEMFTVFLKDFNIELNLTKNSQKNIPASGAAIVIANHPTGVLDGVIMIEALVKTRPDVRFMGNFLLSRIEPVAKYFITVDPFDSKNRTTNQKGIRQSIEHLRNGGLLVVFPAGEVATWQKGVSKIEDKKWGNAIVKFIRKANVPVVPAWIEANNSLVFHLAGKISPVLRTAMLPHELMNKKNKKIHIRIGSPIKPQTVAELADLKDYGNYLRASVSFLQKEKKKKKLFKASAVKKSKPASKIIEPVPVDLLCREIEIIRNDSYILHSDSFELFLAPPDTAPNLLKEIGRLRESTFRSIGEGTQQETDNDRYDAYYHQLFIWDSAARAIVGAYRMGLGDKILKQHGIEGFYTHSLFRMKKGMRPYLKKTIELGRSFIAKEYQRKALPLLLLWKGILHILIAHPEYEYLLGATSISGKYSAASKLMIANWLKKYHGDEKLSALVKPVTGMKKIRTAVDLSLIENIESAELIHKLVMDIENQENGIPVLIRKYLQLNSRALAFNVDPDFCNALDALMFLEVKNIPEEMIKMVNR